MFALCVSSFAGNYLQNLQYQRVCAEKAKLESIAQGAQITTLNHVMRQFDKKIVEMATSEKLFKETVAAAAKRLEQGQ